MLCPVLTWTWLLLGWLSNLEEDCVHDPRRVTFLEVVWDNGAAFSEVEASGGKRDAMQSHPMVSEIAPVNLFQAPASKSASPHTQTASFGHPHHDVSSQAASSGWGQVPASGQHAIAGMFRVGGMRVCADHLATSNPRSEPAHFMSTGGFGAVDSRVTSAGQRDGGPAIGFESAQALNQYGASVDHFSQQQLAYANYGATQKQREEEERSLRAEKEREEEKERRKLEEEETVRMRKERARKAQEVIEKWREREKLEEERKRRRQKEQDEENTRLRKVILTRSKQLLSHVTSTRHPLARCPCSTRRRVCLRRTDRTVVPVMSARAGHGVFCRMHCPGLTHAGPLPATAEAACASQSEVCERARKEARRSAGTISSADKGETIGDSDAQGISRRGSGRGRSGAANEHSRQG